MGDYKVGELISKLKETGEYDNTIFVYTSDNGPTGEGSAWPLRGAKGGSAEGGVRVPSFVSGPNIKPGVLDSRTALSLPMVASMPHARSSRHMRSYRHGYPQGLPQQ